MPLCLLKGCCVLTLRAAVAWGSVKERQVTSAFQGVCLGDAQVFIYATVHLNHLIDLCTTEKRPVRSFTSQRGRQQEVGPILPDQVVGDHVGGGPAAQEPDVPDELRRQG